MEGLPAVILARRLCGGLEAWNEIFGEEVICQE
jgi:hypothetical protein